MQHFLQRCVGLAVVLAVALLLTVSTSAKERRIALVIGNGAYEAGPLANPQNDARAITDALTDLGFRVTTETDADRRRMLRLFQDFEQSLGTGVVGFFFYSGHGMQVAGQNWLIPIGADIRSEADVPVAALPLTNILSRMRYAGGRPNFVILDACRDNPFARSFRTRRRGLIPIEDSGTLVAFSAASGEIADDGEPGGLSPYTEALVDHLRRPGVSALDLFLDVQLAVKDRTRGRQAPNLSLPSYDLRRFVLRPAASVATAPSTRPKPSVVTPPQQNLSPIAGATFRDCEECPEMVVVPAGAFFMGSPKSDFYRYDDEEPQHTVTLARDFAIGRYEVTFAQWDACVADGGCRGHVPDDQGWGRGARPVVDVSWEDARAYTTWLSRKSGKHYRLPTEAEWEYAARAGTQTRYVQGNMIDESRANFGRTVRQTATVGSYTENPWGLYDVHGNVWEWVQDCWFDTYTGAPTDGAARETPGCERRVLRGGSWTNPTRHVRSAVRDYGAPDKRGNADGFRVARSF